METWQINLSLIPSIALILASANRMALGLTDEINSRLLANEHVYAEILPYKIKQLKRLSLAVLLMYLSLSFLVVNALLVGVNIISGNNDKWLIMVSVLIFLLAICFKIWYSASAYFIRQRQFKKFIHINSN